MTNGLQLQIETMEAIGKAREKAFAHARAQRDILMEAMIRIARNGDPDGTIADDAVGNALSVPE